MIYKFFCVGTYKGTSLEIMASGPRKLLIQVGLLSKKKYNEN